MRKNFRKDLIDSVWEELWEKNLQQYIVGTQSGPPYCPPGAPDECPKIPEEDPGLPEDTENDKKRREDIKKDPAMSEEAKKIAIAKLNSEIQSRNKQYPGSMLETENQDIRRLVENSRRGENYKPDPGENNPGYRPKSPDGDPTIPGRSDNPVGPQGTNVGVFVKISDQQGKPGEYKTTAQGYVNVPGAIKEGAGPVVSAAKQAAGLNPTPQNTSAPAGSKNNPNTPTPATKPTAPTPKTPAEQFKGAPLNDSRGTIGSQGAGQAGAGNFNKSPRK